MKLIGLCVVRNESWCLRTTMAAALQYLDHLVVLDHASTDDTGTIITSFCTYYPDQITRLHEADPAWNEATYRQRLLDIGRGLGGTHFVVIDADEILTANLVPCIRQFASSLIPGQAGLFPWIHLWRSLTKFRVDDSPFGAKNALCKFMFADCQDPAPRYVADDGYQLHCRLPSICKPSPPSLMRTMKIDSGGVLHLQHANWERVCWKQLWYQMTEKLRWGKIRANYSGTCSEKGLQLADVPTEWFYGSLKNLMSHLELDKEPWHKKECLRLRKQFGQKLPHDIDTFGLLT